MSASFAAPEPIPAVDILGGRVVRLLRGERERRTIYGGDPEAAADAFAAAGARWLHVVDLDAAFGIGDNAPAVRRLVRRSPLRVQAAGGVRSVPAFVALREAGAARVVFGTAAVERPGIVAEAIGLDAAAVAVALDVARGGLATRGWEVAGAAPGKEDEAGEFAGARRTPAEIAAAHWGRAGAGALVYTSVARDGTMEGPDLDGALRVAAASGLPTIVAGGVGSEAHLRAAAAAAVRSSASGASGRLAGVILGRALYEKRFTLPEARAALGAR